MDEGKENYFFLASMLPSTPWEVGPPIALTESSSKEVGLHLLAISKLDFGYTVVLSPREIDLHLLSRQVGFSLPRHFAWRIFNSQDQIDKYAHNKINRNDVIN